MNEKQKFSERLRQSLRNANIDSHSPTRLTLKFNLRYRGAPVSTQAVRKWLEGKTIPSQDKLVVLAQWLNVSAHWLRFGTKDEPLTQPRKKRGKEEVFKFGEFSDLAVDFNKLGDKHKLLVKEIIQGLLALRDKDKNS